ncbi:hypothetical protein [Neptuniibacter sp. CAU 1671]|uniref:hypothetical protein n=1 Tax=Neptuniibacter sp. CAU 1671 TaxID=3032593 RepID=UPI0023DA6E6C|nr:hypothetical protein [Neptuniibacter sp. CAU 1671]MDF2181618.1 hypothetical protein [Neptuniibacter sp. CAU 1671]
MHYISITLALIVWAGDVFAGDASILVGNQRISAGDSLQSLYSVWGRPDFSLTSEHTCKRLLQHKKTYCSRSRKVWKRGDEFWLVQHSGSMIIKISFTRFESGLTEAF